MRIFIILLVLYSSLFAKEYGLVVGINNKGLKGAVNDAVAMKSVWEKYHINNVQYLYNDEATKNNILNFLSTTVESLHKGDRVYFFFSGHGTSAYDPSFRDYLDKDKTLQRLLAGSGALIPWDFDESNIPRSIISAKRDLAPLFRKIDAKGAFAVVMIDACFSGSAYKEISFSKTLPIAIDATFGEETYPYENIIYLAATAASDWAVEDKSTKPYRGYFSKALENCLYKHENLQAVKSCLESSDIPQSVVVYPKNSDIKPFTY